MIEVSQQTKFLLIVTSLGLLIYGTFVFSEIFSAAQKLSFSAEKNSQSLLKAFELADKVLAKQMSLHTITFIESGESPFRTVNQKLQQSSELKQVPPPAQIMLFLKGILIKNNALAIIEDETGKTYICKEKDTINNQVITKIEKDNVTLRSTKGTITKLTVIENNDRTAAPLPKVPKQIGKTPQMKYGNK